MNSTHNLLSRTIYESSVA